MTKLRSESRGVPSAYFLKFLLLLGLLLPACGNNPLADGITANVLVLVLDPDGNPVPGATVWVPTDGAAQRFAEAGEKRFVDPQGNSCANPPADALFLACTGSDGIAVLPCGDRGTFLLEYFLGAQSGTTNARCAQEGVVPAPLNP